MRQKVRNLDEREEEALELASIGLKKPRVSGPLDKMVADGKTKQTMLNKTERRQWRDLAHEKLSILSWKIVTNASGANEDPHRSRRTLRRHANRLRTDQEGSSNAAIDDMNDERTNKDDLDEDNIDD
ncbi:uncharacterized protein A4U43_C03F20160 [Asparagus officinalis]|uniref:Uncharacterized protein n=1 Tax=Asparagus officinalis TaxID=4686 RepID=A0A5P1FCD7_ASPOF|nr:uncharacterized protein A4U43_C03F20160 [Asparagus officinalis]